MKKNILLIFLATIISFSSTCTLWAETATSIEQNTETDLELSSDAAILMDATTGEILYEKNSNKKEYPASITKIMTALLAFESGKMDETITFSHDAIFGIEPGSSHIALQEEEQITMEQAMYALLLRSANEAALGIAEQVDGSVEKFATHMTERAKELGCKNTNFVNPNGLHSENHYTTAYDMALIAKEALKFEDFKNIIQTTYYEIPPTNKQEETRYLYGQHQMIKPPSIYVYEGCEGGKTGFTDEAQNTLVTYAKRNDTELIAVVFQCKGAQHYEDTIKLFDYGFSQFKTVKLSSASEVSQTFSVVNEKKEEIDSVFAKAKEDVYQTVPIDFEMDKVTKKENAPETLSAPISLNDAVASVTFYYEEKPIATAELFADHAVTLEESEENVVTASMQNDKKIDSNFHSFPTILSILIFAVICSIISFFVALIICRFISWRKRKRRRFARRRK